VKIRHGALDVALIDSREGQYNGMRILDTMRKHFPADARKMGNLSPDTCMGVRSGKTRFLQENSCLEN
jgi:hypothetical protein